MKMVSRAIQKKTKYKSLRKKSEHTQWENIRNSYDFPREGEGLVRGWDEDILLGIGVGRGTVREWTEGDNEWTVKKD